MDDLISAIIASTPAPSIKFDAQRTDILYSDEAVNMVNAQVNIAQESGKPISVYARAPKHRGEKIPIIGHIVSSEIRIDNEYQCRQCLAKILLYDPVMRKATIQQKVEYCFFPLVGYNNEKSLKKAFQNDNHEISYLHPPLRVMAVHLGPKRSSSNPHLIIL